MTAISPDPDPVRAEGPETVIEGEPGSPLVIVLDPAGAAKHGELPATWRPFTYQRRIVWCRLPTDGALTRADEILGGEAGSGPVTDVVASGPFAGTALRLAERHADTVRALLLADPAADRSHEADLAEEADEDWERRNAERIGALEAKGLTVRVIAHSSGSEFDRLPAPLPLGHSNVVANNRRSDDQAFTQSSMKCRTPDGPVPAGHHADPQR
jgi:hypothetical protein